MDDVLLVVSVNIMKKKLFRKVNFLVFPQAIINIRQKGLGGDEVGVLAWTQNVTILSSNGQTYIIIATLLSWQPNSNTHNLSGGPKTFFLQTLFTTLL